MMTDENVSTLSDSEDVTIDEVQEEVEEVQVEETTESDYDKAWKNIDVDTPPDNVFGETTEEVTEESDETEETTEEVEPEKESGFTIKHPVLKFKGKEIPIDDEAELIALAQKGFKFNDEMSKLKPKKQLLNIVEGISMEDLKAFADAKNGNEQAMNYIAGMFKGTSEPSGEDFFGEETKDIPEGNYTPEITPVDDVAEFFKDYSESSPANAGKVSEIYAELDDQFKQEVYQTNIFPAFVKSIESGEFDDVYPMAIKIRNSNPAIGWVQAYGMANKKLADKQPVKKKVTPPKGTSIPKSSDSSRELNGKGYDSAYSMSLEELENKIFS